MRWKDKQIVKDGKKGYKEIRKKIIGNVIYKVEGRKEERKEYTRYEKKEKVIKRSDIKENMDKMRRYSWKGNISANQLKRNYDRTIDIVKGNM